MIYFLFLLFLMKLITAGFLSLWFLYSFSTKISKLTGAYKKFITALLPLVTLSVILSVKGFIPSKE